MASNDERENVTANMASALSGNIIRPCLVAYLDIDTDPVSAWTGPGIFAPTGTADSVLNNKTFQPLAPVVSMSPIVEDQAMGGAVTLTLTGHDLDSEALSQVVKNKYAWRGKDAYLWLALLDTDEGSVIDDPVRIKTGLMVQMAVMRRAESAVVRCTIDVDLGNARAAPYRYQDHSRLHAGDTFGAYMVALANKPGGFEAGGSVYQRVEAERRAARGYSVID